MTQNLQSEKSTVSMTQNLQSEKSKPKRRLSRTFSGQIDDTESESDGDVDDNDCDSDTSVAQPVYEPVTDQDEDFRKFKNSRKRDSVVSYTSDCTSRSSATSHTTTSDGETTSVTPKRSSGSDSSRRTRSDTNASTSGTSTTGTTASDTSADDDDDDDEDEDPDALKIHVSGDEFSADDDDHTPPSPTPEHPPSPVAPTPVVSQSVDPPRRVIMNPPVVEDVVDEDDAADEDDGADEDDLDDDDRLMDDQVFSRILDRLIDNHIPDQELTQFRRGLRPDQRQPTVRVLTRLNHERNEFRDRIVTLRGIARPTPDEVQELQDMVTFQ